MLITIIAATRRHPRVAKAITAAAIATAAFIGGRTSLHAQVQTYPMYLVINPAPYADGSARCNLTLDASISNTIKRDSEGTRQDLCVTKVDLNQQGLDNIAEELGDSLIGMYAATNPDGTPKPFSVYIPVIAK